jgi:lysophospholipase L1-like esterase
MKTRFLLSWLIVLFAATALCQAADAPAGNSAIQPEPRDAGWVKRHEGFVAQAKKGDADILFMGDSITDGWRGQNLWKEKYKSLKAVNFGIGGDRTQHVLWRIQNGECDGIKPKVIVLMIGTNNAGSNSAEQIAEGVAAIVKEFRTRLPEAKILLLGVFPRAEKSDDPVRKLLQDVNSRISKLDDGKWIKYLDIGAKFLDTQGTLPKDVMPDFLHPNAKGYKIWADAMDPTLQALLK